MNLLFKLLLFFYPREFRRAHDRELEALYRHCFQTEKARRGRFVSVVRALLDAVRGAVALRRSPGGGPTRLGAGMGEDLRFACRVFRRAPASFAGIVLVVALGIGANGAVFSLVQAVLLEPLPYADPQRVVVIEDVIGPPRIADVRAVGTTSKIILGWRRQSDGVLSDLAALKMWQGNLDAQFDLILDDRAERLRAGLVTPNFFQVLGVDASLGRVFSPSDEREAHSDLVVLSHRLWRSAFSGDPAIVGSTITFITGRRERGPRPYTVLGVLPPAFRFTYPVETELWALYPWATVESDPANSVAFNGAVGRLRPGVSAVMAAERIASPEETSPGRSTRVQPVTDWVSGKVRASMLLMAGVALLLLLIACATVANALLVRFSGRRRELAVRASVGAPRLRLLRQLLAEGVLLAAAGTLVGSLLAVSLLPAFRALVPSLVPRGDEMGVDFWIVAFAAAAVSTVTLLATVVPALQGSRVNATGALSRSSDNSSTSAATLRWRFGLVTLQAAVSTVLLAGSTLLLVSFWQLGRVDLGFDAEGVTTVEMRLLDRQYREEGAVREFQTRLMNRVRALPGVLEAASSSAIPFRGVDFFAAYDRPGDSVRIGANKRAVNPSFFSVMQIPLRAGRLFTAQDTAGSAPVVVVSDSFAREMFPDGGAVGRTIEVSPNSVAEIVGVVGDVRYVDHQEAPRPAVYLPSDQWPVELVCLLVRTAPGVERIGAALRHAIQEVDPTLPAMKMAKVDNIISDSISDRRFYAVTTGAYAGLALLLTAAGLIVVVARAAVERRREMAIRAALGAQSRQLTGMLARQGLVPVLLGTVIGLAGAAAGARLLQRFLFEVAPSDPLVYGVTAALTIAVATLACLIPARRLLSVAPAALLRGN